MEKWFKDFASGLAEKYAWMVKYETEDGAMHEEQIAGTDAQDVADHIRKVNGPAVMIFFISKLDNTWN